MRLPAKSLVIGYVLLSFLASLLGARSLTSHVPSLPLRISLDVPYVESVPPPAIVLLDENGTDVTVVPMARVPFVTQGDVETAATPLFTRYYVSLTRETAKNMMIEFPAEMTQRFSRIYMGTWLPQIFYSGEAPPGKRLGIIHVNWSGIPVEDGISLPNLPKWEQGGMVTSAVFCAALFALLLSMGVALVGFARFAVWIVQLSEPTPRTLTPFQPLVFLGFLAPLVAIFSVYWMTYYPAILHGDPHHQLEQYLSGNLRDNHPLLSTLTIGVLWSISQSWVFNTAVQIASLSCALAYAFSLLLRAGVPRKLVLIVYAVALFSPRIAIHSITIWKDVPYSILCFLLTILLAHYFLNSAVRTKIAYWILLGVVLGLIPLFRHNGFALLLAVPFMLLAACWPHRKFVALAILVSASVCFIPKQIIYPQVLNGRNVVTGVPNFWTFHSTVGPLRLMLAQDIPLSVEESRFLYHIRALRAQDREALDQSGNLADWKYQDTKTISGIVNAEELLPELVSTRDNLLRIYPLVGIRTYWLERRMQRAQFVLAKSNNIRQGITVPYFVVRQGITMPYYADRKFENIYLTWIQQKLHSKLTQMAREDNMLYDQPVVHVYLVLLCTLVVWRRQQDIRSTLPFLPVLLNTFAVLLVAAGTSDRYHFPLELSTGFLLCLALLPNATTETPAIGDSKELVEQS